MQQPTRRMILDYLVGALDAAESAAFEQAVRTSASLRDEVAACRRVLATMRTDDSEAPSPGAIEAALAAVVPESAGATPDWWSALRRVIAVVAFDSRSPAAAAGFRGSATAYQLSFEADDVDVDLEIHGSGVILGNVTGDGAATDVVLLHGEDERPVARTSADPRGNFRLEAGPGSYRIALCVGERAVVLGGIRIE